MDVSSKIKKEKVERERMYLQCVKCGRKIYGTSEAQVIWNLNIHNQTSHDDKLKEVVKNGRQDNNKE